MLAGAAILGSALVLVPMDGVCAIVAENTVTLSDSRVRYGDVADLQCVEASVRAHLARQTLLNLPEDQTTLLVTREDLAGLVRTGAFEIANMQAGTGSVRFERAADRNAEAPECRELSRAVASGEAVTQAHSTGVPCDAGRARGSVYFDRTDGVVRALSPLSEGVYLGRIALPESSFVDQGEPLTMRIVLGNIRIERQVVAMEASAGDARIFVRDADGHVFPLPVDEEAPSLPETGGEAR